ncbi:MAG: hypothetical protein R3C01_16265 [Planctomycetaceae bacterium]
MICAANLSWRDGKKCTWMCRFILLVGIGILGLSLSARADLYTGAIRSVDWIVDSSDFMVQVKVGETSPVVVLEDIVSLRLVVSQELAADNPETLPSSNTSAQKVATKLEFLKQPSPEQMESLRIAGLEWMQNWRGLLEPGDEWILAGRWRDLPADDPKSKSGQFIFQGINLTRPLQWASTAAVTPRGVLLRDRESILEAFQKRLKLQRTLPPNAAWDVLETMLFGRWTEYPDGLRIESLPPRAFLGGVILPIDVTYWDEGGLYDDDTIYLHTLAPADPEYQDEIFERANSTNFVLRRLSIGMLINYPGPKTERFLETYSGDHRDQSAHDATRLLDYWQCREQPDAELNLRFLGQWRLLGRTLAIDLILNADQTATINIRPRATADAPPTEGFGKWRVEGDLLYIQRTRFADQRFGTGDAQKIILPGQPIISINDDEVQLAKGLVLTRSK